MCFMESFKRYAVLHEDVHFVTRVVSLFRYYYQNQNFCVIAEIDQIMSCLTSIEFRVWIKNYISTKMGCDNLFMS